MNTIWKVLQILDAKKLNRLILLLSIGAVVLQSYFFYGYSFGIGYPLFVALLIGILTIFQWVYAPKNLYDREAIYWWISALFFACMVAVRREELLTFFNVIISLYSLALFASRGILTDTLGQLPIFKTLVLPAAYIPNTRDLLRGLRWPLSSIGEKEKILRILSISIPLLILYFILFSAGDLSFREAFGNIGDIMLTWLTDIVPLDLFGRVLFALILLPFLAGILHAGVYGMVYPYKKTDPKPLPVENTTVVFTPLYTACIAFVPFTFLQIQSAFRGHANISSSLSYASYAKDGYFALLLAALLTLGIIIFVGKRTYFVTSVNPRIKYLCFALLCQVGTPRRGYFLPPLTLPRSLWSSRSPDFMGMRSSSVYLVYLYCLVGEYTKVVALLWMNSLIVRWGLILFALINILNPAGFVAKSNLQSASMIWAVDTYYLAQLSADSLPSRIEYTRSREELESLLRGEFRFADCVAFYFEFSCIHNLWVRWSDDLNQTPKGPWFTSHLNDTRIKLAIKNRLNDFAK
jgi:hypothetical protein